MHRIDRSFRALVGVAVVALVAISGCAEGQPVDAGGERGGGGLAFVLMTVFLVLFMLSLFYLDRVRKRRSERDSDS